MAVTPLVPQALGAALAASGAAWDLAGNTARLWAGDASLWTGADEGRWLGWLDVTVRQRPRVAEYHALATAARADGCTAVLLIGMGGSSLAPDVLARVHGVASHGLPLAVLDSTDPAQVRATLDPLDPARTVVVVASKSGSTMEPNVLAAVAHAWVERAVGPGWAGRFIAITDPGSALSRQAATERWHATVLGEPEIGGRFSALSPFGLLPAALLGVDLDRFLDRADRMRLDCDPARAWDAHPAVGLGLAIATAARHGRDKLTLRTTAAAAPFGDWMEQLVAESLGKRGVGVIPVIGEPGDLVAGDDRLIVSLDLADPLDLAAEFYRWEFATAVAGAALGVHPFDQPDVEASKVATRALTEAYERDGGFPPDPPDATDGTLAFHGLAATDATSAAGALEAFLGSTHPADYVAVLAFLPMTAPVVAAVHTLRAAVARRTGRATTVGFGPRYLHSTGQAHKGGPPTGVFLLLTADDSEDIPIPGRRATLGVVRTAQARGDFAVLRDRGRRVVRVHLGGELLTALDALRRAVEG
jgi:glucose-6-phosphate isomerase